MSIQTEETTSSLPPSHANPRCVTICTVGELFGGVERHILGLMEGLIAQGVSVPLVLFHDGELAAQARDKGVEPIILSRNNYSLINTSRQLASILQQHGASLVHVHGYKATVYCAFAIRQFPVAMIKTEHGLPEPMAVNPLRMFRNWLYYIADVVATRSSNATVCYVTEDLKRAYRHVHARLRTLVIPNGVGNTNRNGFSRPSELSETNFNLLIAGRVDRVKGHHYAVKALAQANMPKNVHLHIAGVGPWEPELQALAVTCGIAERVHFLGFKRNILAYIAHCNILLMPSLHEGLPYTLLEAMALGIPIVATRVGGLAEVVQDKRTGVLVPSQDTKALAQAICRLYQEPALRSQLGSQARRLQQAKYSLEAMTERYLAIYRELVGSSS